MPDETQDPTPSSQSLDDVLARIVAAEEAGQPLDRQALLAQQPRHADELREFFVNRDQMQRLAAPLRDPSGGHSNGHQLGKIRYFGDYELLDEIAAGGMGIVYKARQVSLNRIVAVKMILKGTLATEDDVKRFRAEAEAAASLQHPGIVAIHEVGLHEGQHYFSMDYVDGQSLAGLPRDNPLSARQAAEYVEQAAQAVHAAHQQGTLHRDLKPSNILIDRQGRVRITDFGLAKRIAGNSDLTLTGQILGTPSYMPPEQALGKRSLIGTASDVYSLGAVLYELLAGRPPFRGESPAETLRQVETLDPISPRLLNPATPRDLETICLKCLDKQPHMRYGTAHLLADDLGRFLRHEPIVARPIRIPQRAMKWVRRHPTSAGLVVMSAVALLALVGVAVGQFYNARLKTLNDQLAGAKTSLESQNEQLQTAKTRLETGNQELTAASGKLEKALKDVSAERAKARRYLYSARMALAQRAEQEHQSGRVIQLLRSVIPEDHDQEDLRDFEWFHLWRKHHGEISRLRGTNSRVTAVAFSPDDKWIVSGSETGSIVVRDAVTGKEQQTMAGHAQAITAIGVAFDNEHLVSASADKTLQVWNLKTGDKLRSFAGPDPGRVIILLFDPFSPQFTALSDHGNVQRWDLGSGELVADTDPTRKAFSDAFSANVHPLSSNTSKTTYCFACAASGDRMVAGRTNYGRSSIVAKADVLNPGEKIPVSSRDFSTVLTQVACSHDGTTIAAAGSDLSVHVWEATTGNEMCSLNTESEVWSMAFSPDGSRLVAGTEDGVLMLWSVPGRAERSILQGDNPVNSVSFGAGGSLLAAACGKAKVWDVMTGREVGSFALSGNGRYSRVGLSPMSRWIAGTQLGGLADADTGQLIVRLPEVSNYGNGEYGLAFSTDETLVARAWEKQVTIHATATGRAVHSLEMPLWGSCAAFSPDSKLVAAGSGTMDIFNSGQLQVCDLATRRNLFPHESVPLGVWGLAFSPNGTLLAAAMGNYADRGANIGRVAVWETATWKQVLDLRGHSGCAWSVAFSPSGKRLASAGAQWGQPTPMGRRTGIPPGRIWAPGEVIIWDVATGHELLRLRDEKGGVFGVAFSPDGRRLATGSQAGEVKLLDGTPLLETPPYEPLPAMN